MDFCAEFHTRYNDIKAQLPGGETEGLRHKLANLRQLCQAHKNSFSARETEQYQKKLTELAVQMRPKPKTFGFKTQVDFSTLHNTAPKESRKVDTRSAGPDAVGLVTEPKDNCRDCVLYHSGLLPNLHLRNLTHCILIADIEGSLQLENVTNSTVYVKCQQLRIHDSSDCTVYVATSEPTIENCRSIHFGHFDGNNWKRVNDFGWLSSEPNPHWTEISEPLAFNWEKTPTDLRQMVESLSAHA